MAKKDTAPLEDKVRPLWEELGYTEDDWATHAHQFGVGPVKVAAIDRNVMPAVAEAVNSWNQSTGIGVFQFVTDAAEADVVVSLEPLPRDDEGNLRALADAMPTLDQVDQEQIRVNPEWKDFKDLYERPLTPGTYARALLEGVLVHELGHIAGLDHPNSRDERSLIMGSGTQPHQEYYEQARPGGGASDISGGPAFRGWLRRFLDEGHSEWIHGPFIASVPHHLEAGFVQEMLGPVAQNPNRLEREREYRETDEYSVPSNYSENPAPSLAAPPRANKNSYERRKQQV